MFRRLYPSPHTGAPLKGKDLPDTQGIKGNESRLVRCRFCGFICDPDRDMEIKGESWAGRGVSFGTQQSDTYNVPVGGGSLQPKSITDYYYIPTTDSGCAFCGSYRYKAD